ncbi:aspartate/glutamate racemase family protein [Winogradskyella immobilis]|uniref:Amino acid racemase n=1 Tax=Winogradskyella immobilis TaxID=2816852 RepID=A0ABS8ELE0_9FLAO|nr:amino acid racemase [Winogradskyella immobilis]MCC1483842.1 amino acid racemase [Winogradskyella immobilis]MCG0015936.1 amino acid racemase [Winogradskyella immobilis]
MKKSSVIILFVTSLLFVFNCTTKSDEKKPNKSAMNSLGLIGGLSWHSTLDYYTAINESVNSHFGNNTNPPLLIYNINQAEIHRFQKEDKWDSIAYLLSQAGLKLKKAGADAVIFCANTPHKVYNQVQKDLNETPIIHIGDATAKVIKNDSVDKVGFIGTKYSMEDDFITKRIKNNNIEVIVPKDITTINELQRIIAEELTYGIIKPESKAYVITVLQEMINEGAKGIVLGCTEFPLMILKDDLSVPLFNTTLIHSKVAVNFILNSDN